MNRKIRHLAGRTAMLALLAACVSGPAWASADPQLPADTALRGLEERLQRSAGSAELTPAEAAQMQAELRLVSDTAAEYQVGGVTPTERAALDRLTEAISARLAVLEQDYAGPYSTPTQQALVASASEASATAPLAAISPALPTLEYPQALEVAGDLAPTPSLADASALAPTPDLAEASALAPIPVPEVVSSMPVPDTPENRARFGQPLSRAGRMTAPRGN